jgi:hypothetical protein
MPLTSEDVSKNLIGKNINNKNPTPTQNLPAKKTGDKAPLTLHSLTNKDITDKTSIATQKSVFTTNMRTYAEVPCESDAVAYHAYLVSVLNLPNNGKYAFVPCEAENAAMKVALVNYLNSH